MFSVIVPVYNAGPPLLELVDRLIQLFQVGLKASYEVLLIDDGSTSIDTKAVIETAVERGEVRAIFLSRNFGKPGAILCGLTESCGDYVITIDDDLQQKPEDIAALLEFKDHDVVSATYETKHHTISQKFTSALKHQFDKHILGYGFKVSPLKMFRRTIVDAMLLSHSNKPYIPALIRDVTNDVVSVPLEHAPSAYGPSRYTFRTRLRQFTNLAIGNSAVFLKLVGWLGLFTMLASLILAMAIIIRKLVGIPTETGWSSVMVAILLLGGLNLGVASLIGQYLLRILDVSSKKPAFIVRRVLTSETEESLLDWWSMSEKYR